MAQPTYYLWMNFLRITTTIKVAIILLGIGIFSSPSLSYASSFWGPSAAQYKKYAFWYQLRDTFAMKHHSDNSKVTEQIHWFHNHQHYLARLLTKAAPYMYYVFMQVKTRHLPGELVLMPIVESAYDPFAYSEVGAAGLWQLMPGTASGYGLKQDWWYDGRRDIYASTGAALDYLTYLQNFFNGNWVYAMASYNAGEGTVQNAIEYNARHNRATDFWELPLVQGKERVRGKDGKALHPTQKPEEMLKRIILASSNEGDTVLDPFLGSGTTAVVAQKYGRKWIGIEREKQYVEISKKRLGI